MLPARAVFPEWEDWPQRAPRSQSFKTPDQNGGMFQAPSPARLRVPVRTGWAATGGCPYKGKRMGNPECDDVVPPFLQP